jgi:hypothetical protein
MLRTVLRLILVVVILVGLASFFVGYRWADLDLEPLADRPIGTTGTANIDPKIDTSRARDAGARIGEKVAEGVNEAQRTAANASLTAKIKSKMALDDVVEAADIDVDTTGTVVTLSGRVSSKAEHQQAMRLARETEGVTSVVDNLVVTGR